MKRVELFDSTIALTAYNWLAMYRSGSATAAEIEAGTRKHFLSAPRVIVPDGQVARCLERLIERGLLRQIPGVQGDAYEVDDPKRRPITRQRSGVDESDPESGWERWCFFSRGLAALAVGEYEPVPR